MDLPEAGSRYRLAEAVLDLPVGCLRTEHGREPDAVIGRIFDEQPFFTKAAGFKIFYHPLDDDSARIWQHLELELERDLAVIHLRRRNVRRAVVSRAIAEQRNVWLDLADEPRVGAARSRWRSAGPSSKRVPPDRRLGSRRRSAIREPPGPRPVLRGGSWPTPTRRSPPSPTSSVFASPGRRRDAAPEPGAVARAAARPRRSPGRVPGHRVGGRLRRVTRGGPRRLLKCLRRSSSPGTGS